MCRVQYPSEHQQQLISNLASLTSSGNTTLPLLLQANAFLSDIFALGLAGVVEPSSILRAVAAVAASPAAAEGFGLHLLVLPAIEALQQLSFYTYVSSQSQGMSLLPILWHHRHKSNAEQVSNDRGSSSSSSTICQALSATLIATS